MQHLEGKVAVVTGAASGIGLALARRFAHEGMHVVLADVEARALANTATEIGSAATRTLAVQVDVSDETAVVALADQAFAEFGAVHLLCNNAGVTANGRAWELTAADWQWVLGVNLIGIVNGIRAFVPRMLAAGEEGHIVNTASLAGLLTGGPANAAYAASKHAAVVLSESLALDLAQAGSRIGVSVLCPGAVNTRIMDGERNRPAHLRNEAAPAVDRERAAMEQSVRGIIAAGLSPDMIAEQVLGAVRTRQFYVLPNPEFAPLIRARMEDILHERTPSLERIAVTPPSIETPS